MKGRVEITYRGIAIEFSSWSTGEFQVDGDKKFATLDKACERIDELVKIHIDKTPVFFENYNKLQKAIATSVNEYGEVFVSFPERKGKYGSRQKMDKTTKVFVDCPENWDKYRQILDIRAELKTIVDQYQEKADAIMVTMQRIGGEVKA